MLLHLPGSVCCRLCDIAMVEAGAETAVILLLWRNALRSVVVFAGALLIPIDTASKYSREHYHEYRDFGLFILLTQNFDSSDGRPLRCMVVIVFSISWK